MSGGLSSMSDADLQTLYGVTPSTTSPLATMSDADLQAIHSQLNAPQITAESHPTSGPTGDLSVDIPRRLGTGAASAIAGIASLPNLAAQGTDWLGGLTGQSPWAQKALSSIPNPVPGGHPLFPDYSTAKDMVMNAMGGTEYIPQTWSGRRVQDVINGTMSGGMTTAALAGPRAALAALPAIAGGAATGGEAAELNPGHPMIAGMLGSIPGVAIGNAAMNVPQRVAALAGGGTNTEPYGAFARLGLPTDLAGTTTGAPGLSYAEKLAARMPGSEGAVADARSDLINSWQNKLGDIANQLGASTTPQETGSVLQTGAQNWLDQFKNQQAARWGLYRTLVPPTTPVAVPGFNQALSDVMGNFGGADNLAKVLQPQLASSLKEALGDDLAGGTTLPSQAVHSVRTALGQMLDNPEPIEGIGKAAIKQLYGGLTNDIAGEAQAAGPTAEAAFRQASDVTRTGHDILDNFVGPVLQAKSPELATQWALAQARQGGTRVEGVTTNIPSAAGDLRAYALRNAATNTESPTSLATALTGRKPIYSPEAQSVLFGDPAIQQNVADLAATGDAIRPFEKDLANSPTATHQTRGLGRILAASELAKQGHELAGMPGAVIGGTAGLLAPNILGRVAQATALNPYMAALYGKQIQYPGQSPSLMARAIMAPTLGPRLPAPGVPMPSVPATSANLAPQSP